MQNIDMLLGYINCFSRTRFKLCLHSLILLYRFFSPVSSHLCNQLIWTLLWKYWTCGFYETIRTQRRVHLHCFLTLCQTVSLCSTHLWRLLAFLMNFESIMNNTWLRIHILSFMPIHVVFCSAELTSLLIKLYIGRNKSL